MDTLREVKLQVLTDKLKKWLNDTPLRIPGQFWDQAEMAEVIVSLMEEVEISQFEKDMQEEYFAECARAYNV